MDRIAGSGLRRCLAQGDQSLPFGIRLSRHIARIAFTGDQPSDRRLRPTRAPPAQQFPQVRAAQRGPWRLGVELVVAGETSRAADAPPRLELLAVRGDALRYAEFEGLRRGCRDLVRR